MTTVISQDIVHKKSNKRRRIDEYKEQQAIKKSLFDSTIKFIIPEKSTIIRLNESGSSYIKIDFLPDELKKVGSDTFIAMWNLHPTNKHKIIINNAEVPVYRYSQSYLNTPTNLSHTVYSSYMYSGFDIANNNLDLPKEFNPFYEHMKKLDDKYNQVIANWYENEQDYIAPHSDCTKSMIKDADISIISFYHDTDPNNFRYLNIKPKKDKDKDKDSLFAKFKIRLDHGSIITMCGKTQEDFVHGIAKNDDEHIKKLMPKGQRLSLSFRQMETV